jgi:hypothetical protein
VKHLGHFPVGRANVVNDQAVNADQGANMNEGKTGVLGKGLDLIPAHILLALDAAL